MVMATDTASATKKLPFLKLKREAGIDLWGSHLPRSTGDLPERIFHLYHKIPYLYINNLQLFFTLDPQAM